MRERRALALRRCAKRAADLGLPMAATVNPFERPSPRPTHPRVSYILSIVADITGVRVADMAGSSNRRRVVLARQFAFWLLRERLALTWDRIGGALNKTDCGARLGALSAAERLADPSWPIVMRWRNRCAEAIGRIDGLDRNISALAENYPRFARDLQ